MQPNTSQSRVIMYHDGDCPLCQIEVKAMQKLDKHQAIDWIDINQNKAALAAQGISYTKAMQQLHVKNSQQQIVIGLDAFLTLWQQLPYYRRLVPIIHHTPLLKPLLARGYKLFAKHRLALTQRNLKAVDQHTAIKPISTIEGKQHD